MIDYSAFQWKLFHLFKSEKVGFLYTFLTFNKGLASRSKNYNKTLCLTQHYITWGDKSAATHAGQTQV